MGGMSKLVNRVKSLACVNRSLTWYLSVVGAAGLVIVPWSLMQRDVLASLDGRAAFDPLDQDADGMSDAWETHYFGSVTARDGFEDDDLDDMLNVDEWNAGTNPLHLDPRSIGESGFTDVEQSARDVWQTVRLSGAYVDPVVVLGPASFNKAKPLTLRVRNITSSSFEFQIDEYDYLNGRHKLERVSWIVVEKGTHELPTGQVLQAGHDVVGADSSLIAFDAGFEEAPVVMSQISSVNGSIALTPSQSDITNTGFSALLQGQEDSVGVIASESLAWIAIEKGAGEIAAGSMDVNATGKTVNQTWETISFAVEVAEEPSFFASMQTTNGIDTSNIRYSNLVSTGALVRVHEERSDDRELRHTAEDVGYLVASPGMFHILATTGDTDADGLADAYELANGLVLGDFDYYGDKDGDGLSNAEESLYGTRADLADSDGDLVSDYDEIHFLQSDALASDVGLFQLEQTVAGADFSETFGEWNTENGNANQSSPRGWVEYAITADSAGVYSVEVDLAPYAGVSFSDQYDIVLSVDSSFVSRESITMNKDETSTVKILTPWLDAGAHNVRVFIDNSYTYRKTQISELRVSSATGTDADASGVADWVEIRTQRQNGLTGSFTESKTSPVCLEGNARYSDLVQTSGNISIQKAPNNTWYADLPLSATENTDVSLSYENGGHEEAVSIQWTPTNLLSETSLTLRQGDALLLTASASAEGASTETVSITIEGTQLSTTADQPLEYSFNNAGSHLVDVVYHDGYGSEVIHQVSVNVVSLVNMDSPVCVTGYERPWRVTGLPSEAIVQIDDQVSVFDGERIEGEGYSYTLATQTAESHPAIARLGYGGPILGNTTIRSMSMRSTDKTGVVYSSQLDESTYVIDMPVVVSSAYDDVSVHCKIILGGVMYMDGSVDTSLDAEVFDEFGSHTLQFIKPKNAHSNCHTFSIWQDEVRIALYF